LKLISCEGIVWHSN